MASHPQHPARYGEGPALAVAEQVFAADTAAAIAQIATAQASGVPAQAPAGCVADDRQLSQFGDASLCHGWAGLIQTTWRAAADAGSDSELATHLPHLHARMGEHLHHHGPPAHDGLLDGAAGVRLDQLHTPRARRQDDAYRRPTSHWCGLPPTSALPTRSAA